MPTADQIKALLKAYAQSNDAQFQAVAMQIAASEARQGHGKLAEELKAIIDEAKVRLPVVGTTPIPINRPRGEVADLLSVSYPSIKLKDLIFAPKLEKALLRIVREHKTIADIRAHGLSPRKKVLLLGPPGTGKTKTASALAGELGMPLFIVRLDRLITRFMGETAAKLRLVFDAIAQTRAVYLFDEFDSIGSERGLANDVGEIRRVVNSFLQMVEQDSSDSLILAATNHPHILDRALFRRFDDILEYKLPTKEQIAATLKAKFSGKKTSRIHWSRLANRATGLSYADVTRAAEDAIKHSLIERRPIVQADIASAIDERKTTFAQGDNR
ncbi:ATP-binding protein [uncultured Hyphomicrobium sp.]|jgi:SpoVK/Ycf46/Vps4 family AAA+-type ATPase|uniref:AAA family ATPase n=1 Tax=uncultured Hyphomicrobium sp. TaxID=194373 RepID=UPI0025DC75BC|nr:ATP-binding protein [uncultured Hyphomicrobium sp.]